MRATRTVATPYGILGLLLVMVALVAAQQGAMPETAPSAAGDKLREALSRTLEDERHAIAFYEAVLARHGDKRPFAEIVDAERRHADALIAQFERLKLAVPADPPAPTCNVPPRVVEDH